MVFQQFLKAFMPDTTNQPTDAPDVAPTKLYPVTEASARVNLGLTRFRALVKAGRIPGPIRITPKRPVWRESDLAAFIAKL
ncbi:MAG: helix-turn-helix transcriptional regulator [Propionivibrio sp.]